MIRFLLSCMVVFPCLTGCFMQPITAGDATTPASTSGSTPAVATIGQYHFGWKLSGNRAVAPLQVFDDGRRTWLQFPPGQPVPAIFARLPQGDQFLTPTAGQAGLLMLNGVWPQLIMRGGSLQSVARRLPAVEEPEGAVAGMDRVPAGAAPSPITSPATSSTAVSIPANTTATTTTNAPRSSLTIATPLEHMPATSAEPAFQVSPADGTLRAALSRWANTAGWTFAFEHWAVEVDIPIAAAATFTLPFEQAVQELVASTELSDQPLRPCFYTNHVLRIVPHTHPCDRSAVSNG